ncbi:MAG: BrnT family toxin [Lachnospiraceae bacterium]|nr:BrnT family toxin [Lachnospiraceae bacterium]
MKFEWDEHKNFINKEKHKISFETAAYVFGDPYRRLTRTHTLQSA